MAISLAHGRNDDDCKDDRRPQDVRSSRRGRRTDEECRQRVRQRCTRGRSQREQDLLEGVIVQVILSTRLESDEAIDILIDLIDELVLGNLVICDSNDLLRDVVVLVNQVLGSIDVSLNIEGLLDRNLTGRDGRQLVRDCFNRRTDRRTGRKSNPIAELGNTVGSLSGKVGKVVPFPLGILFKYGSQGYLDTFNTGHCDDRLGVANAANGVAKDD